MLVETALFVEQIGLDKGSKGREIDFSDQVSELKSKNLVLIYD